MVSLQIRRCASAAPSAPSICPLFFWFWFWVLFLVLLDRGIAQEIQVPAPISVPPSTSWDGNDGPWSSFTVQIGSPPQAVRVLPSSSGSALWAVVAEGCTNQDPPGCPEARGAIFNPNASSTWVEEGLYGLPVLAELAFGYGGNGRFGFDSLVMSYRGGGGATVDNAVIAGIATKDFYLGTLGLTPYGTNFTDFNDPKPSILKLLRDSEQIPSRSWAYTAGAYYSPKKTFGSLLFGGYDTSRFMPNNLTIGLGQDITRHILVGVQSIRSGEASLLDQGIIAYIDSTIPHIWLPVQACQNFERAFGLTWDSNVELYLVNDTQHSALLTKNPTVTWTIASSIGGGEVVDIEMPYTAFDLEASQPLTSNGTSRYFPLRRAQNETQYALGRTFLQYAYLIVDYDRNNFSVSQAVFPDTGVAEQRIAILDPSQDGTANSTSPTAQKDDAKIATGTIVGIVIGVIVAVLIAVAALVLCWKHRQTDSKQRFGKSELDARDTTGEEPTQSSSEAETAEPADSIKHVEELSGNALVEAVGDKRFAKEMQGSGVNFAELEGSEGRKTYHELP